MRVRPIRRGVVTVEIALILAFVVVPMFSLCWLVGKGGYFKLRAETALAVSRIALDNGETVTTATNRGQGIMTTIGGTLTIGASDITATSSVAILGKNIPIISTIPRN